MKKILFINGSLRKNSFNLQLALTAAEILSGKAQTAFLEYSDIPFMNQDIEYPAPAAVERVRAEVLSADGLWILTPEYNGSYSGVLKNLLDWLSRPLEKGNWSKGSALSGKKVTISSVAGKSAGANAREKLSVLLKAMKMNPADELQTGFVLSGDAFATDKLTLLPDDIEKLKNQAERFLEFLEE